MAGLSEFESDITNTVSKIKSEKVHEAPLAQAFNYMDRAVEQLYDEISILEDKLRPISLSVEKDITSKEAERPVASEIVSIIHNQNSRLIHLSTRLRDIRESLEI